MRTLAKMFDLVPVGNETTRQLVYRAIEASTVRDPWERRVVELGEGRSIDEITAILYREELRRGAWAADIGLWKNFFNACVLDTIAKLESQGYVRVVSSNTAAGSENAETRKPKSATELGQ